VQHKRQRKQNAEYREVKKLATAERKRRARQVNAEYREAEKLQQLHRTRKGKKKIARTDRWKEA
jgi:hypothetical protein